MWIRRRAQQSISYAIRRGFFNKNNASKPAASGAFGTETIKPAPESIVPPGLIAHELDNTEAVGGGRTFSLAQQTPASKPEFNPSTPLLDHQKATTTTTTGPKKYTRMQFARFPNLPIPGFPNNEPVTTALLHYGTGHALYDRPNFHRTPFPYPRPSSGEWPFDIRDFPGMGKGMCATEDIPAGELILNEKLLLVSVAEIRHESEQALYQLLERFVNMLDLEERKGFFGLFNCKGTSRPPVKGIMDTNMIAIGRLPGPFRGMHGALGLTLSRINHSCCPNALCGFDVDTLSMSVVATRPIQKDEQIFISYIPTALPREKRYNEHERLFFTCTCPSCQLSGKEAEESDVRRELIYTAKMRLVEDKERDNDEGEAMDPIMSQRIVEALDKEGLTVSDAELAKLALCHTSRLSIDCFKAGDKEGFVMWGNKYWEIAKVGLVEEKSQAGMWEEIAELLEAPDSVV